MLRVINNVCLFLEHLSLVYFTFTCRLLVSSLFGLSWPAVNRVHHHLPPSSPPRSTSIAGCLWVGGRERGSAFLLRYSFSQLCTHTYSIELPVAKYTSQKEFFLLFFFFACDFCYWGRQKDLTGRNPLIAAYTLSSSASKPVMHLHTSSHPSNSLSSCSEWAWEDLWVKLLIFPI